MVIPQRHKKMASWQWYIQLKDLKRYFYWESQPILAYIIISYKHTQNTMIIIKSSINNQ